MKVPTGWLSTNFLFYHDYRAAMFDPSLIRIRKKLQAHPQLSPRKHTPQNRHRRLLLPNQQRQPDRT
jgi:hypothetical protein